MYFHVLYTLKDHSLTEKMEETQITYYQTKWKLYTVEPVISETSWSWQSTTSSTVSDMWVVNSALFDPSSAKYFYTYRTTIHALT